ncbi:hypothetical protein SPRG_08159 [Saprolegnia parasitica CBS 223.65]|uniref:Uncharacterized protein n=1 Tax=Saprolegnia parasitica (strain CBS 223.65) TaxID=695850 RepID=A0A067CCF8_SAPPC|nr:hypothetical protein SPRG_08159 [Saprolegnia parasitica CBS 223.65]KDO26870.1 hypothetical protein SPRG_08159 [Saprolegnia parasitica CBS 223.65]|eukprot:XP_012202513.1 hypothetical protein SPRG_08159 [Saprolegnia parasitica CBS 223.65]
MSCPSIYHDTSRFTCPCYSKMGECLVRIGCSFSQRKETMASCTRKGYCKAGYCTYRLGDFTPKLGARREIFDATAVVPPDSPCVDGCCPGSGSCTENPVMRALRQPGRAYRLEEPKLPPR